MKIEKQIKALAELDGWKLNSEDPSPSWSKCYIHPNIRGFYDVSKLPNYLTSYDAIIPLIGKQTDDVKGKIDNFLCSWLTTPVVEWILDATPEQLCEALLRAVGKWEEEC